jgi:hypothetical protein
MNSGIPRAINVNRLQGVGSYNFNAIITEQQATNGGSSGGVELFLVTSEAGGTGQTGAGGTGQTGAGGTGQTGAGGTEATSSSSTLQPYRVLNFIIKT